MNNLLRKTGTYCKRNASTILTGAGVVGVVGTAVLAVKATPKALALLEQAKEEKNEELTRTEKVLVAGPSYIPAVITGVATIACIVGANVLNKRQQAALMSAYALVDNSFKEYKKKVQEIYGEEADKDIRKAIADDKVKELKDESDEGDLYYDEYSQTFFRASKETVTAAECWINREVTTNFYATLNELYTRLGLPKTDFGDYFGWSSAMLYDMYWESWIDFYHEQAVTEDGKEYYILRFTEPVCGFDDDFY